MEENIVEIATLEQGAMLLWVPSRFFEMHDLPSFKAGIRDFKAIWGQDSGLKVLRDVGCQK